MTSQVYFTFSNFSGFSLSLYTHKHIRTHTHTHASGSDTAFMRIAINAPC